MADNFTTQDASASTVTLASKDIGSGVQSAKVVHFVTEIDTSLTRPADTTAYAVSDAVTTSTSSPSGYTFSSCVLTNGGYGTIIDAQLILSNPNATLSNFELWLFNTAPTIPNDNAAFSFTDGEADTVTAVLKFYTSDYSDSSNNRIYHMFNPPRLIKCAGGSTSLTGVLKTMTAFTPVASETFRVKMKILQDI